ncbi:hypothetical protein ACFC7A_31715 [Streptomyces niveus]|uniref:hypothetical protein n=1 Tax=Streptomyces niveus TaxID=193462 RepID=UPI0035DEA711
MLPRNSTTHCVLPARPVPGHLGGAEAAVIIVIVVVGAVMSTVGGPYTDTLLLLAGTGTIGASVAALAARGGPGPTARSLVQGLTAPGRH